MARGRIGVVRERWRGDWAAGVPLWRVTFVDELVRDRILRADYLRVLTEGEPTCES